MSKVNLNTDYNVRKLPPQNVDPDTYAKQYAAQKGISVEEAKTELRAQFGDPQKPQAQNSSSNQKISNAAKEEDQYVEFIPEEQNTNPLGLAPEEQELFELGIPVEVIQEGDNAIMNFAKENDIDLPEKKENSKQVGNSANNIYTPNNSRLNGSQNKISQEQNTNPLGLVPEEQELLEKGVPLEVIQEGKNAIMNFIKDNNIEL